MRDVVDNEDGAAVFVAWEGHLEVEHFHPAAGLCPRLLSIDGLTGRTLQAAVLRGPGSQTDTQQPPQHPTPKLLLATTSSEQSRAVTWVGKTLVQEQKISAIPAGFQPPKGPET